MSIRFLLALFALTASGPALADQIYVEANSNIVFDQKGRIVAVRHQWRFDEDFSAYAVEGLDADGDGAYSRSELDGLARANMLGLAEKRYFTYLGVDEEGASFRTPRDYWLDHDGRRLELSFTLPLKTPVEPGVPVALDLFDRSADVIFDLKGSEPVRLANAPETCLVAVKAPSRMPQGVRPSLASLSTGEFGIGPRPQTFQRATTGAATISCGLTN